MTVTPDPGPEPAFEPPGPPSAIPRWDLWRRRFYLWTLTLAMSVALLAAARYGVGQALGVLCGAAIGLANLHLLGRAAFKLVQRSLGEPDGVVQGRFAPLAAVIRWPLTALATVAVLWYMPGQPEGLATGVALALLGFVTAGLQAAAEAEREPPGTRGNEAPPDHRHG